MKGTTYLWETWRFGLTEDGIYKLSCEVALSRYVGLIEITTPKGELFDVVLDATETNANPAALVWVRRKCMPSKGEEGLRAVASKLGAEFIR